MDDRHGNAKRTSIYINIYLFLSAREILGSWASFS